MCQGRPMDFTMYNTKGEIRSMSVANLHATHVDFVPDLT